MLLTLGPAIRMAFGAVYPVVAIGKIRPRQDALRAAAKQAD